MLALMVALAIAAQTETATVSAESPADAPKERVATPRELAEELIRDAKTMTDRKALEARFVTLDRAAQAEVLELWKRDMPITGPSMRSRDRLVAIYEHGSPAPAQKRAATIVEQPFPEPAPEITLALGEYFTGLIGLVAWELFANLVFPTPTSDNALILLALDGVCASLVTGGIAYGVASASDYYEPTAWAPILAAGVIYFGGSWIAVTDARNAQSLNHTGAIVLGTLAVMPLAATLFVNFTKKPIRTGPIGKIEELEWRARETIAELETPNDGERPVVFTLLGGSF